MKNSTYFASNRPLDVICLGRLAVDLYAQQVGARLEDVTSFAKYLGGSSANIAFGTARLGLKSAMLSRVGNDHMGRFLTECLEREGCDTSHVRIDHDRLTALVILGLKDRDTFPLIFYRENCADMAVDVADFDESFIASSKALLITGTHFSTEKVHATSLKALQLARKNNVRTILDIDYRPVLWGLTGKADGETRYISNEGVTAHLQKLLPLFDLIVGTEEEFRIAGGHPDLIPMLRAVRAVTDATLVVKRGVLGCSIIEGPIPDNIDDAPIYGGVRVEVLNVLGAGDAFMSGFLSGWIRGEDYEVCAARANGCGALVVSRHACAPAMPTPAELDYFLKNASENPSKMRRPDLDKTLVRLHKVSVARAKWSELFVFAFDHRIQFFELAQKSGSTEKRISVLKNLLVEAVSGIERESDSDGLDGKLGILCDGRYGQDALNASTGRGWWIGRPVELPGSNPLEFEDGSSVGTALISWPAEHVIKCLVFYSPDDPVEHRLKQEAQVRSLYDAAQASGHELLLEIIPPKDRPQAPDAVFRALKRFYNLGIQPDWWKLEPMTPQQWEAVDKLITESDPYCRGVLLLGLNLPMAKLAAGFQAARDSTTCRGFAVGRTIFEQPSLAWLGGEIDDAEFIARIQTNFRTLIDLWRASRQKVAEPAHELCAA
ncbi:MAG TPA: 5-dehydro-2-deoxygluconokinase [Chthoniobacterales bacterium]